MRSLLIGLMLAACGGKNEDTSATQPDPYLADESPLDVPDLDNAALETAIEQAVQALFTLDPLPLVEGYAQAVSGQDEQCPSWATTGEGDPYWYSTCESESGTRFDGFGLYIAYDEHSDEGHDLIAGPALTSISTIQTPEGHTFTGAGGLTNLTGSTVDGYPVHYVQIGSGFSWDGPEAAGTWLETGIQPDLQMYALTVPGYGQVLTVNGSISGTSGAQAVVFDDLTAFRRDDPQGCPFEPNGLISVRGLDGNWMDLEFTGPTTGDDSTDENGCDQCAAAWFKGVQIGDSCPDLGPLFSWEGPTLW